MYHGIIDRTPATGGSSYSARVNSIFSGDRVFELATDANPDESVVIKRDSDDIHIESRESFASIPGCYRLGVCGTFPLADLIRALGITADDLSDAYGVNVDSRGY